jgi:hypothetical protein
MFMGYPELLPVPLLSVLNLYVQFAERGSKGARKLQASAVEMN